MYDVAEYYALTRKAFDFLAPVYNLMTLPLIRVRERVVDFAGAGAGSVVLDVATGTGQQAFAFAEHGCDVTAVDLTEAMLAIARKHNRQGWIKLEAADATRLRFGAESFDITCISFALHDMPLSIREQVLKEMVRVTKSAGLIMIVDYDLPRNRIGASLVYRFVSLYESQYYKKFIYSDLHGLLEKAGIEIKDQRKMLLGAARILKGAKKS